MQNKQTCEVILLDRTEMDADGSGAFMTVYNMDGTPYKIGLKGRNYGVSLITPRD